MMLRHFPMKNKPEFTTEIGEVILEALAAAQASQFSAKLKKILKSGFSKIKNSEICFFDLKQESVNFKNRMYTPQQLYDFCNYISKQPEFEVRSFVRTLCDVTKYYQRPL